MVDRIFCINHIPYLSFGECDKQFAHHLETIFNQYTPVENEEKIYFTLWLIAILYRKYEKLEITKDYSTFTADYLEEIKESKQYFKQIRPEMLRLFTFLKGHITTKNKETDFKTSLPIRIEAGAERIEIDNTAGWFTCALEKYLHTCLGVNTTEKAAAELKTVYSSKGRKPNIIHNLIMMGTYHLLLNHSGIKPKSKIIRFILDFLELLELSVEKDDENNLGAKIDYLEKRDYKPKWNIKPFGEYQTSPNNQTGYLW